MGYLPLAIEQAGAYIREAAGCFATFLDDYEKYGKNLRKWVPQGNRQYPHSVATTSLLSFSIVRKNHPGAAALFQLLAFLNPDGILSIFYEMEQEFFGIACERLCQTKW